MKRTEGPTPNGGAYAEAFFFNDDYSVEVDEAEATKIIIKEFTVDGELTKTTYGECSPEAPTDNEKGTSV